MTWAAGAAGAAMAVVSAASMGVVGLVAVVAGAGPMLSVGSGVDAGATPAVGDIPPALLTLYRQAASACPGLSYTVLAAIGTVESSNGESSAPGVRSGANSAGAEGPMQFLPATFAEYAWPVPPGGAAPPSPYDPTDALFAAARLLCVNGAGAGGSGLAAAVFAYNHSTTYVGEVLDLAARYAENPDAPGP